MPISRSVLRVAGLVVALITAAVLAPGVSLAAPPDNDDFDTATVVSTLPFAVAQDTTLATAALDDPGLDCDHYPVDSSVWFRYTPAEDGLLRFSTAGSDQSLPVTVYTGDRGDLQRANPAIGDCIANRSRSATLRVTAGTTYHLMISGGLGQRGGALKFAMDRVLAPANDNFTDAQPVSSLPFTGEHVDLGAASIEADEPHVRSCHASPYVGSVWYSYTPAQTQFVLSDVQHRGTHGPSLAVYEGTSLADLRQLSCGASPSSGRVTAMTAGKTYYLQYRNNHPSSPELTASRPRLSAAPELRSSIGTIHGNKSTYDPIFFQLGFDNDYDTLVTNDWDFGDGTTERTTGSGSTPHRYAADGRYTVTVRSKSADGRSATATYDVVVDTRNVEITKLVVPASARAGETKPINLAVKSHHGAEPVTVVVYRSYRGGPPVGERQIVLSAQPAFATFVQFHHTFTQQDVSNGSTTFVAEVKLPAERMDARPDNNTKGALTWVTAQSVQGAS